MATDEVVVGQIPGRPAAALRGLKQLAAQRLVEPRLVFGHAPAGVAGRAYLSDLRSSPRWNPWPQPEPRRGRAWRASSCRRWREFTSCCGSPAVPGRLTVELPRPHGRDLRSHPRCLRPLTTAGRVGRSGRTLAEIAQWR